MSWVSTQDNCYIQSVLSLHQKHCSLNLYFAKVYDLKYTFSFLQWKNHTKVISYRQFFSNHFLIINYLLFLLAYHVLDYCSSNDLRWFFYNYLNSTYLSVWSHVHVITSIFYEDAKTEHPILNTANSLYVKICKLVHVTSECGLCIFWECFLIFFWWLKATRRWILDLWWCNCMMM